MRAVPRSSLSEKPLGRRPAPDTKHLDRFPLGALPEAEQPRGVPVVIGVNWYTAFDRPQQGEDGRWWAGLDAKNLGSVRGGHCVCVKSVQNDPASWWSFYDQGCNPAGTLVRMEDGSHKAIEDVKVLDRVATAEGRAGYVLTTFARFTSEGLIRLMLAGHRHLRLTANHPVLTARGYVPAGRLRIGDEVALTRYSPEPVMELRTAPFLADLDRRIRRDKRLVIHGSPSGDVVTEVASVPEAISLTSSFGRLVGLFLAEGGTTPNKVQWTFGGHERETLVTETADLVRECLGGEARTQERPNGTINVVLYGKVWRTLFERMLCWGPFDKRLPGELASGPPDFLQGVWNGWVAGDGWWAHDRSRMKAVTVSHSLALDMYAVGQTLGLRPTIALRPGKPGFGVARRRDVWEITVSTGGLSTRSRQDENAVWRKVVGVEEEDFAGFVFNMQVEGDNSFVAEGVGLHNSEGACVGFGSSRMMSLLNRRRYNARWLWDAAKATDDWPETRPGDEEGTSVRAALDTLRSRGHVLFKRRDADLAWQQRDELGPAAGEGISAYRWTTQVEDVLRTIAHATATRLGAIPILNSWGRDYPHIVWIPGETAQRIFSEDGEVGLVTDR